MTSTLDLLREKREEILRIAAENGVTNVRVFGSVARGEDTPDSDIDFLVDMEEGADGLNLGGFQYDSTKLLGRYADVCTTKGVSHLIKDIVLSEATAL